MGLPRQEGAEAVTNCGTLPTKWEGPEVAARATPAHSSRCPLVPIVEATGMWGQRLQW